MNELNTMHTYFDDKIIYYLEIDNFEQDGSFKPQLYGKYMLIMVGGSFCGHCKHTAPDFNAFAKNNPDVVSAVVQVDGPEKEKKLGKRLGSLVGIIGIPAFLLYGPDGKFKKMHTGDRSEKAFKEFVDSERQ